MLRHVCTAVLIIIISGCTTKSPGACQDGVCIDPERPYCDSEGVVGGLADACIALTCEPGDFVACTLGGNALKCTSTGDDTTETECAAGCGSTGCVASACDGDVLVTQLSDDTSTRESCLAGCVSSPSPHCTHLAPRYLPDVCDTDADEDLVLAGSGNLDTDLDANCTGGVVVQAAAPELCVLKYRRIDITPATTIKVVGTRSLAMVADGDLAIRGELDVSATGLTSGPGGGSTSTGGGVVLLNGGGGAGFQTVGGAGGSSTADGGANNRGATSDPTVLVPLFGGPKSGGFATSGARGGGGGGGATLISCRGAVIVEGVLAANGGGGGGGFFDSVLNQFRGGSGGGAGGYVVLQGLEVRVTGSVFANGGAGGSGFGPGMVSSRAGDNGSRSATSCATSIVLSDEGIGGPGGCIAAAPGNGGRPIGSGKTAGGGGGSMGYFQSFTPTEATATITPIVASPGFQPPLTVPTR